MHFQKSNMKQFTLFLFLFLSNNFISGQNNRFLSFELAGSGGIVSFNFENSIRNKPASQLYYRIGFSLAPIDRNNGTALVFPLMLHHCLGKSAHKLDLGIGQTVSITTKGNLFFMMPLSFGYRFQPENKRHYWRFAYTPIVSYLINFQWQHWVGITFGLQLSSKK